MEQIFSKAVGIDLGTTNSAVAVMNRTDTDVVIHQETRHTTTTPSCVWKDPRSGEIVVGRMAFRRIGSIPEPVRSIKRLMGHQTKVEVTDEEMTPEQVSGLILAELKRQIEQDVAAWNGPGALWTVDRAIVTVPAYFDHPSIEATRKAGELAGLEVLDLLHEPTAAACYHCWSTKTSDGTFLVYDLGGGTFDVSVVRCTAGVFEVLGISGNNRLGGDNLDIEMARRIQEYLVDDGFAFDLDLAGDPEDQIRFNHLKFLAEGVKKALSRDDDFMLRDTGTVRDKDGSPVMLDRVVERSEFEDLVRPTVERTIDYCHEALALAEKEAGITLADVDQVVLAGGSTHIPLVRELVADALCTPPGAGAGRARCAEPFYDKVDTIVALGAAIRAAAAGGLVVHDAARTVRVSFRGTGSTGSTTTRVAGKVEALTGDRELAGGQIFLTTGDYEEDAQLDESGTFAFTGIPIQPGAESRLDFEVLDRAGEPVVSTTRLIEQGDDLGPKGGESTTAKLAKSFVLEVIRGGKPVLKELLPAMTALPTSANFTFSHPGDTETVRFVLYERKRQIQVITVPVPSTTPRGTPIRFNVRVDGLAMITVKGSIGDTTFDALVERPPERELPTAEEIGELAAQFDDAVHYLKPGDRAVAEAKWGKAKSSMDNAIAGADQLQAVHEFEELEAIVAEMPKAEAALEPAKEEFDQLVDDCRYLNVHVRAVTEAAGVTHDQQEVASSIDAQAEHGERAWQNRDQAAYGDAIQMLHRIKGYLLDIYEQARRSTDTRTDGERAEERAREVAKFGTQIRQLAEAAARPDLQQEISVIQRRLADLERDAHRSPGRTQQTINQLVGRLVQIQNLLNPKSGPGSDGDKPVDLS